MLLRLIQRELLDHLLSLRFAIACILCFIVILTSLYVRCGEFAQRSSDYFEDRTTETNRLKNINRPWRLEREGVNINQPPSSLSVFVQGSDTGSITARVTTSDEPQLLSSDSANPTTLLFPPTDVVSFVGIIMSLLAIVFGYDTVSGEKERGTLRLLLSYSVPRDTVLLGKWIGGYVALTVPFLLAIFSGAAVVLVQPSISLSAGEWGRLGLVSVLSLVYIAVMYAAAVWVSCLTARSSTSVMILVTVWMVLVLAVPNLAPYFARSILPPPNPTELLKAKEEKRTALRQEIERKMEIYDKENFAAGTPWHTQVSWREPEGRKKGMMRWRRSTELEYEAAIRRIRDIDQLNADYANRNATQSGIGKWLSRVSPFACFASASAELTDTGQSGRRRFLKLVRTYQETLATYVHDEMVAQFDYEIETGQHAPNWSDPSNRKNPIPVFAYSPPPPSEYVAASATDVAILVASVILFFMLSYKAFLRYDAR